MHVSTQRKGPHPQQPAEHLMAYCAIVSLLEFPLDPPHSVGRICRYDLLHQGTQPSVFLLVADLLAALVIPGRAWELDCSQGRLQVRPLHPGFVDQLDFLFGAHSLGPKNFFKGAISTSFLAKSRSSSAIFFSYSPIVPSCSGISGPFYWKTSSQFRTVFR